jgi:hypothetical protein
MRPLRDEILVHDARVKLVSGFLNAVGLGLIAFALIRPLVEQGAVLGRITLWWSVAGLALHAAAHYILGMLRQEPRA